jgi:hypothetical protein
MARKSLRPHLNQIRSWVRQGRTDAWVAHQLDVNVQDITQYKRQNDLRGDDESPEGPLMTDYLDEIDLRAEDDALIAAELEAAAVEAEPDEPPDGIAAEREAADRGPEEDAPRTRRRGRRGGRGRRSSGSSTTPLEGTFDHGEEGYGLWLDPAIQDNPIYAEHWAGHRNIQVTVEEDQIVITRIDETP